MYTYVTDEKNEQLRYKSSHYCREWSFQTHTHTKQNAHRHVFIQV